HVAIGDLARHRDLAPPALEIGARIDDLQRDDGVDLLVVAAPDRAAAAGAEPRLDAVATRDDRARHERRDDDLRRSIVGRGRAGHVADCTGARVPRPDSAARAHGRSGPRRENPQDRLLLLFLLRGGLLRRWFLLRGGLLRGGLLRGLLRRLLRGG